MALRDLLAKFDISTGDAETKLRKLDGAIGKAAKGLGELAQMAISAFAATKAIDFIKGQIDAADAVSDTAAKLGIGTDELQKFQFAAKLAGVEAEQAAAGLGFLNKNVGEAITGNGAAGDAFARLGVAIKDASGNVRPLSELVPELADGLNGLGSQQERTAAAMAIFGKQGASLLPMLAEGANGLQDLYKEFDALGGGLEGDFLEQAGKAGDALDKMHFAFGALKSRIALAIMPTFTAVSEKLTRMIGTFTKITKETNLAKYAWAGLGIVGGGAAAQATLKFGKLLGIIKPTTKGAMGMMAEFGKAGLVAGGVTAIGLAVEDIYVGMKGGQSVIRDWLNETMGVEKTTQLFDGLNATFDQVSQSFDEMIPVIKELFGELIALGAEAGPGIASAFMFIVKAIGSAISLLTGFAQIVTKTVGAVVQLTKGSNAGIDSLGSDIGKIADRAGERVFGKGGFFGTPAEVAPNVAIAPGTIGPPLPPKVDQKNDIRNNVNVTVQGGATNAETGRSVASAVKGALSQADLDAGAAALATGAK